MLTRITVMDPAAEMMPPGERVKRVLIVQPSLAPPGGGNGVAAWMVEVLKGDHALTLLTWARPDFAAVNRYFGTALSASDLDSQVVPAVARALFRLAPAPLALLKDAYLFRRARAIAPLFDLVIVASNEADLGCRGIQYVHYARLDPERPALDLRWYHGWPLLTRFYRAAVLRLTGFSPARMKTNLTLVNSEWSGARVRALHGIDTITLHPPVHGEFPDIAWERRENGFLCIGRISPEKRLIEVIDILSRVRQRGQDIHLHIVGSADNRRYAAQVRGRAAENASWVFLEENVSRTALVELISKHRYGIHGMREEHFGMAVAEMVRGGCVVFTPDGGGQVEIAGAEPRLCYSSPQDAVEKLVAVLTSEDRQRELLEHLRQRAALFSLQRFSADLHQILTSFQA